MSVRLVRFVCTCCWVVFGTLLLSRAVAEAPTAFAAPPNLVELRAGSGLNPAAEKFLMQNGFVVIEARSEKSLQTAYPLQHHVRPMLVTTDAMLQLWFDLHQDMLKNAEKQQFAPRLLSILTELNGSARKLRAEAHGEAQAALKEASVTLAVAEALLSEKGAPVDADLKPDVDALIGKVRAHSEVKDYPGEDYTQYTVRGHYADDPVLTRYFLASMWLTRRIYAVPARGQGGSDLRSAIALAACVRAAPDASVRLARLNDLRQTLAGPPNSISVGLLERALARSLGPKWTADGALKPASLAKLRRELSAPEYPRTPVHSKVDSGTVEYPDQFVSVLPGIALPDSVLFENTMNPAIPNRSLPTGLEVGASLGYPSAADTLRTQEPADADAVLAAVNKFGPAVATDDGKTIYSGWLQALKTLAAPPKGAPAYMRSAAWKFEKLNTALSSWAELRHSYILYGEQPELTQGLEEPLPALVEPYPEFYRSMAALSRRAHGTLKAAEALSATYDKLLTEFEQKCLEFQTDAVSELAGKLTQSQSRRIDDFGDWLKQFPSLDAARIADVATGMYGEVLHVGTGRLYPMLVIPDPKTGTVYTGWVTSYYELARGSFDRMTDARWRQELESPILPPTRPAWMQPLIPEEHGALWQERAPLREAEALLLNGKSEAGLAILRKCVAEHGDSPVATEAQLRIGKVYFEQKQFEQALAELERCRRLPGCDAYDEAIRLSRRCGWERMRLVKTEETAALQPRRRANLTALRTEIEALKTAADRSEAETSLARKLLAALDWATPEYTRNADIVDMLALAANACRTHVCRDALGYAALMADRMSIGSQGNPDGYVRRLLAYMHGADSAVLRAGALAAALAAGYLKDNPKAALAAVRPYLTLTASAGKSDAAWGLLAASRTDKRMSVGADPVSAFLDSVEPVFDALIADSYHAGKIRDALRYSNLCSTVKWPYSNGGRMSGVITRLWQSFGPREEAAIAMYGVAQGLDAKDEESGVRQRLALVDRYPKTRLAPYVLGQAVRFLTGGDNARAEKLRLRLYHDYPTSYPALIARLEQCCEAGDFAEAHRAVARCKIAKKLAPPGAIDLFLDDRLENYEGGLPFDEKRLEALKPFLDAARSPRLVQLASRWSNGYELAEALATALPNRAHEIYPRLAEIYGNPSLNMRFLERYPDHPHAGEIWRKLVGRREGTGTLGFPEGGYTAAFPACLRTLAPFVNRGSAYAHGDDAVALLIGCLTGGADFRTLKEEAKAAHVLFPGTRAASVVDLVFLQALVSAHRPEEALHVADTLMASLPDVDRLKAAAVSERDRAQAEIEAKRRPEWTPLWHAALRSAIDVPRSGWRLPVVSGNRLFAYEPDAAGLGQVAALDTATGIRAWTSAFSVSLRSFAADGDYVACVLEDGRVACLAAQTGKSIWEKSLAGEWHTVVCAGDAVIVCGEENGIAALTLRTGAPLWKRPEWKAYVPAPMMPSRLPVDANRVIVACADGTVRAVAAETGIPIWEKKYPAPPRPANDRDPFRNSRVEVLPFLAGKEHVLVSVRRSSASLELLSAATGTVERSVKGPDHASMLSFAVDPEYLIVCDFNGATYVHRLPGLAPLDVKVHGFRTSGLCIQRGLLYGRNDFTDELEAVSLKTGVVMDRYVDDDPRFNGATLIGDGKLFAVGQNGSVTALPLLAP